MATELLVLGEVILINAVLSGDNAVAIGLAAAGLEEKFRVRAIVIGMVVATVLRVVFSVAFVQLMAVVGLKLAGGLLLCWVAWKMFQELEEARKEAAEDEAEPGVHHEHHHKTFAQAFTQILIADISMSLDNVLAVASLARNHLPILVVGLILSILFMGFAAMLIARLLEKHRWIGYVGLALIVYVAGDMVWDGGWEVFEAFNH